MTSVRYTTTPLRAIAAVLAGLLWAAVVAQSRVWAAFGSLGVDGWLDAFWNHLYTIGLDFGPSFVLALLGWVVLHSRGVRDAKYATLVGAVSFYLAPRIYGAVYIAQTPYWSADLVAGMFAPKISEIIVGVVLCVILWAIAYWQPSTPKRRV